MMANPTLVEERQENENVSGEDPLSVLQEARLEETNGLEGVQKETNRLENGHDGQILGEESVTSSDLTEENARMDVQDVGEASNKNEDSSPISSGTDPGGEDSRGQDSEPLVFSQERDLESDEVPSKKRKTEVVDPEERERIKKKCVGIERHRQYRRTGEPFLQHIECDKLKTQLGKCLECKMRGVLGSRLVCRFYSFRMLRYNEGQLTVCGFPDVTEKSHYKDDDSAVWLPGDPPQELTSDDAKFLLQEVGDLFCQLVKQEKETIIQLEGQAVQTIIWRRVVQDLRELCDVCSTTLFNHHWTCGKCGFVVCVACFKSRKAPNNAESELPAISPMSSERKDNFGWLKCGKRDDHDYQQLILTQIVVGKCLDDLWMELHKVREQAGIPAKCDCKPADSSASIQNILGNQETSAQAPAPVAIQNDSEEDRDGDQDGIFDLLGGMDEETPAEGAAPEENGNKQDPDEEVVKELGKDNEHSEEPGRPSGTSEEKLVLKNFVRKKGTTTYSLNVVPKSVMIGTKTSKRYPNVPHDWSCSGLLLRLLDPSNPGNLEMFQHQWKRGQPVIVSNVGSRLDPEMWLPEAFSKDFGHEKNHFINCMTGKVVPNKKMKEFWDGFEHEKKRLTDDEGTPMLLKLKDWPPGADFAKTSPARFDDLMQALPLGEYTHRDGKFNLTARVPPIFCKPDLGPKMYIAYGSGLHLDKGTTNLHLDVSDAVNVMVYVGELKDDDNIRHNECVRQAILDSDCDTITQQRVLSGQSKPGALWHIYEAQDADKIRDMINKVKLERGIKVERHHDSIHDQSFYLDGELRRRLRTEYNVVGYPIIQCAGDAVFIPAGAPHQVRNLNNCIKIAEDFVSPENVGHCFYLTEEFRNLTETHTNHEDKLQVKNIVFHAVKDAVSVIRHQLSKSELK